MSTFAPKRAEPPVPEPPAELKLTLRTSRKTNVEHEAAEVAKEENFDNDGRYTSRKQEPQLVKEPALPKKGGQIEPITIDGIELYHFTSYSLDDGSCLAADIEGDAGWLIKVEKIFLDYYSSISEKLLSAIDEAIQ